MTLRQTIVQAVLALAVAWSAAFAIACNVPVFRYALERWRPDVCQVIVFHDRELSEGEEAQVQSLEQEQAAREGANIEIVRSRIQNESDRKRKELWTTLQVDSKVALPYVVIQTSLGSGQMVRHWSGNLADAKKANLLRSPVRSELTRRLLRGDSVVWLMLKSNDAEKDRSIRELLTAELDRLSKKIQLPDGIGLPGSELYSEVPLFVKFTILELDPDDRQEELLVKLMSGFETETRNETLLAPVFGRGRALDVIPAKQLNAGLIEDLTMFLCGACSCQVKERNPGFDLLLSANWNRELYGDEGEQPPEVTTLERAPSKPTLLTIPSGRKKE